MVKEKSSSCFNCEVYMEMADNHEKIIKKMLKALPVSTLRNYLIDIKIVKEDYLTNEISWVTRKKKSK